MDPQCGRDQVHERRLVFDLQIAKQLCARDVTATPVSFNSAPVIGALQHVLSIFRDLQLNHDESSILSQSEKIYWANAEFAAAARAKLRVQRRDDQAGIQSRDIASQD